MWVSSTSVWKSEQLTFGLGPLILTLLLAFLEIIHPVVRVPTDTVIDDKVVLRKPPPYDRLVLFLGYSIIYRVVAIDLSNHDHSPAVV